MSNKGFLLVLMQPPPAFEDEFNAWYDDEHVPERTAVPGFESGRRFVCIDGHPKYLALYDMANEEILETEAYRAVSGDRASPWTKRVTSRVKVSRYIGQQIYPGNEITLAGSRTLLLRFSALRADAAGAVIAGMKANFGTRPSTLQIRVFAHHHTNGTVDFFGLVASRVPDNTALELSAFGGDVPAPDLVNLYASY